ncbi:hypothetical protein SDC9_86455 [bioreactor metagenome]|uniref:Uncharacterized protein n=1 Tax=bioreactor metagenome TaxID=1076179 RepID=A0A644ZGA0_9ZZZZ
MGLTHQTDGLGKALVLLFHLRQQPDTVIQRPGVHGQLVRFFRRFPGFALPLLHFHGVPGDDVGNGPGLVPGVLQRAAVGLCLAIRLVHPLPGAFKLRFRSRPPL